MWSDSGWCAPSMPMRAAPAAGRAAGSGAGAGASSSEALGSKGARNQCAAIGQLQGGVQGCSVRAGVHKRRPRAQPRAAAARQARTSKWGCGCGRCRPSACASALAAGSPHVPILSACACLPCLSAFQGIAQTSWQDSPRPQDHEQGGLHGGAARGCCQGWPAAGSLTLLLRMHTASAAG